MPDDVMAAEWEAWQEVVREFKQGTPTGAILPGFFVAIHPAARLTRPGILSAQTTTISGLEPRRRPPACVATHGVAIRRRVLYARRLVSGKESDSCPSSVPPPANGSSTHDFPLPGFSTRPS
jgi:hypothetical protein